MAIYDFGDLPRLGLPWGGQWRPGRARTRLSPSFRPQRAVMPETSTCRYCKHTNASQHESVIGPIDLYFLSFLFS